MAYTTEDYQQLYRQKKCTVADALTYIHSHDVVGFSGDCNEPVAMLEQMHTIAPYVEDVVCFKGRIGT